MDTVYTCKINNLSTQNIKVEICFNKEWLDSVFRGRKYTPFLLNYIGQDSGVQLKQFDTIQLKAYYEIASHTSFTLEDAMNGPDYMSYNKIYVYSTDTLVLNNPEEISKAFRKINGNYQLVIR